jgi:glycine/D-amino acid oxidase-like deaminating enzyme
MLNDPKSHGLWEKTAPSAPPTSRLEGITTTDVTIVGAGYTGLSAALHLAEAGIKSIVLEAKEIGFGGAGRNVGLINAGMWVQPDDLVAEIGPDKGERLITLLGQGPSRVMALIDKHQIACELTRSGTLHCAVGQKGVIEVEERARQWQKRGAPVQVLSAEETEQRTGTNAYAASLLDERAGTLQPLAYARGLARAAIDAGATIFTDSPVISTARDGARWTVHTPHGAVTSDWIIVATDAYSTGPWAAVRNEQVHLPYFNLATVPLSANALKTILPNREGAWDTKDILSSFRLDQAGRLVFGSVGALAGADTAIHKAWARRALARLFPEIADVEFEQEWYGKIGMTANALPRFHRFAENVVGFSGYNGRGIAPGTVFGEMLARLVAGRITRDDIPLPETSVEEAGFRRAKEAFYRAGAVVAHVAGERF